MAEKYGGEKRSYTKGSSIYYQVDPRPEYRMSRQDNAHHFYCQETNSIDLYGYEAFSIKKNPIQELTNAKLNHFFRDLEVTYTMTGSSNQSRTQPLPCKLFGIIPSRIFAKPAHGEIFVPALNRNALHDQPNSANFTIWGNSIAVPMSLVIRIARNGQDETPSKHPGQTNDNSESSTSDGSNIDSTNIIPLRRDA